MFYRPEDGHGLPHNPFSAIVSPRPIGWIGSRGSDGRDNLAPYSFFNAVAYSPPQVMFASTSAKADRGDTKDSVGNIRETGVFSVNIVGHDLSGPMNLSSGPWAREEDEFVKAGLDKAECETVAAPRVAAAPATLECRLTQIVQLPGETNLVVFGEVTGVHIADAMLDAGRYDVTRARHLARLGYRDYCEVREVFELKRPGD